MNPGIKVFAPATVSNLGCGFDILGFALEKPGDEIVARLSPEKGVRITKITGAAGRLPYEPEKNTAGVAVMAFLEHLGESGVGIELEIHKKMPFGSGLGSSAASAVAGVVAANELLNRPLEKRDLLPFAMKGESMADGAYHADNVAPSLLGGIILIRNNEALDVHRLPTPKGLIATVVYPEVEVLTKDARKILSDQVSLSKHIEQTGNLGGLIVGLFQSDFELIRRSLKDVIIEPQRSVLIPCFDEVQETALSLGALGCSISGAGPSIFALSDNTLVAEEIGRAAEKIFQRNKINCQIFISNVNQEGAIKF